MTRPPGRRPFHPVLRRTLLQSLPAALALFGLGKRISHRGWSVPLQSVAGAASRPVPSAQLDSNCDSHRSPCQAPAPSREPASPTRPSHDPSPSGPGTHPAEPHRDSAREARPENRDRLPDTASDPPWLIEWLSRPIQPVLDCLDMTGRPHQEIVNWAYLRNAMHSRSFLILRYHGGAEPGRLRRISPALIFHKLDDAGIPPLYVLAWCHLRNGHRTFRLDRMRCL